MKKVKISKMNQKRTMTTMLRLLKNLSRKPLPHQLVEAVGEVLLDVHADQEAVVVLKKSVCFCLFVSFYVVYVLTTIVHTMFSF